MLIYIAANKNSSASLHLVEPKRNENTGTWVSIRPYINSSMQKSMNDMIRHSNMNWNTEPEALEIKIKKTK